MMEDVVLKFAAAARATGMRVATSEVLDCLAQLPRVDLLDETQVRTVLRAHFAKSRLEQARFDHVYRLFFGELRETVDTAATPLVEHMQTVRREILRMEPQLPTLAAIADFLVAEPQAYLEMLREMRSEGPAPGGGPRGAGSNLGNLVRRLPVLRALQRVQEGVDHFLKRQWKEIHWETRRQIEAQVSGRLAVARRLLTADSAPHLPPADRPAPSEDRFGALGGQSFASLSPGELILIRDTIARLVRKLRDTAGRRQRARSRGVPDVKRTLRAAMGTQGIPLVLKYRHKPPRKGRILVLCDVSGSVWSSARFMLTMLYQLQDCFERVKSFVFVDEPVAVTDDFADDDIDRALERVVHCPRVAYEAATDYGRTLRLFADRHLDAVTKKTTVLVIGDGRSNYGNPEADILAAIRERCRRLLWLNPEDERFWHSGDSEIATYGPLCNEMRPCRNLNQLAAFIEELVL